MPNLKNFQDLILKYPNHNLKFNVTTSVKEKDLVIVNFLGSDKSKDKKKPIVPDFPYFEASPSEVVKAPKVWYAGVGPIEDLTTDTLGSAISTVSLDLAKSFSSVNITFSDDIEKKISPEKIARFLITSIAMAVYPVDLLKTSGDSAKIKLQHINVIVSQENVKEWEEVLKFYNRLVNHVNGMRQVQALPANYLTPETMEKRARLMATKFGLKIKVFNKAQLEKLNAGGILSVGRGSAIPPRMIILEYTPAKLPKGAKTLALIGKGVTFDSGGISIKPSSDMHEMKYDMSGAAAAVHAIAAIADLKLPLKVVCGIGLAENMPDGNAVKPGDVYMAYNGKTIEVQNTDAEGRLILGDVLSYVDKNYKADLMVDLATLTGACMVALGNYYAGLFTNHDEVKEALLSASSTSLEPLWPLPMGPLYQAQLKSNIADFNNIGDRWGGASSAASFLSIFVDKKTPWAHLDIAGIADMKKGFGIYTAVGTGFGVRLLAELARSLT